jgi:hypothetical protein
VWDLVIQACAQAWGPRKLMWSQSPTELIVDIINERDEALANARRYLWLNNTDNFLLQLDGKPVRLKCGDVLDRWIDARLERPGTQRPWSSRICSALTGTRIACIRWSLRTGRTR